MIPTYKRPEVTRQAIISVFEQDLEKEKYELIVVDSSPDNRIELLAEELQSLAPCSFKFYRKDPEGPGPSRNLGVLHARGEFVAFMDSDCQATPGWLRAGLAAFEQEVGIIQGRTLPDPNRPLGVFKHYIQVEEESFIYEAANIFYRLESFKQAGEFLPDWNPHAPTPLGGEDVDLAWRVKRAGWRTRFATDALVYHEVFPLNPWDWLFIKRLAVFPSLVRRFPELRQFFFLHYFYDRSQAFLTLALLGGVLGPHASVAFLLCLPYAFLRASEPTRTLRGLRRPLRAFVYLPRDLLSFMILVGSSVRARSLLL